MEHNSTPCRLEYRVWDDVEAADRLEAIGIAAGSDSSTHVYLIGSPREVNVKLRDGAIDVKHRIEIEAMFERWCPAWRTEPPFGQDAVERVFDELVVPPPSTSGDVTTDELVALAESASGIAVITATKHRTSYQLGEVNAELTRVLLDDGTERVTVAVEGTDIRRLLRWRNDLGLSRSVNRSYPAALASHRQDATRAT